MSIKVKEKYEKIWKKYKWLNHIENCEFFSYLHPLDIDISNNGQGNCMQENFIILCLFTVGDR